MTKFQESETLEFKQSLAEKEELGKTIVGMANKLGGVAYFGIKNDGSIIGLPIITEKTLTEISLYFSDNIEPRLYPTIEVEYVEKKEVIKITIPRSSQPYHTFKNIPYIRIGPTTKKMSQEEYKRRLVYHQIANRDYSATFLPGATLNDLSSQAISTLRKLLKSSGRYTANIDKLSDTQLLKDLLLIRDNHLTVATLALLGNEQGIAKYLPFSEIRYAYRSGENEIHNQDTAIYRQGYLCYYKEIWKKIDSRNLTLNIPYQMRLIDKKTFDEVTIREAINNAIAHRDYLTQGSILLIQYPNKICINSPGGFPEGITIENIIFETRPRNKLIADILFKCELVEQFGNGVNLMYKNQLSLGKMPPNYSGSNSNQVILELDGTIQDMEFAKYVIRVAEEKGRDLNDAELIVLNQINNNKKILGSQITNNLLELGLIEKVGHDRYLLSKQYYQDSHKEWEYTKRKGLSRNQNKELILEHLRHFTKGRKRDFMKVLNFCITNAELGNLLTELKDDGKISYIGIPRSKSGYWQLVVTKIIT